MQPGGRGGDRAGNFSVGGLVGLDVGRIKIRAALGPPGFQNVRREGGATEGWEIKFFDQGAYDQLASRDGFFDAQQGLGWGGALEGVWKEVGTRGEAFGRSAERSPPPGAGSSRRRSSARFWEQTNRAGMTFELLKTSRSRDRKIWGRSRTNLSEKEE